jgi:hypothetical protein
MGEQIRIIVALDVEAKTPEDAYKKLYDALPLLHPRGIDWESTDEWYGTDGEALTEEAVSAARLRVLSRI